MGVESSVFFFSGEVSPFLDKEIGKILEKFVFSSVNSTKISLLKYFSKIFNVKNNEEKHW
jgi:hypothetical protein